MKEGTTIEYYTSNRSPSPEIAQVVQFDLKQIGLNLNTHLFARAVQISKEGTRGEPFDITGEGWIADYADPYDFVNVLLDGSSRPDPNNNNVAYFDDPTFNKQMSPSLAAIAFAEVLGVRQSRREDDEHEPAVGAAQQPERSDPRLEARGLLHLQLDLRDRPRSRLLEVGPSEIRSSARRRESGASRSRASFVSRAGMLCA